MFRTLFSSEYCMIRNDGVVNDQDRWGKRKDDCWNRGRCMRD